MRQAILSNLPLSLSLLLACAGVLHAQGPAGCPIGVGSFTGCYYNNTNLSGSPALIRQDSQINFVWGSGSPATSISPKNFSVAWQGDLAFTQGTYTFTATASDGIRLYIDGQLLMDHWQDQSTTTFSLSQTLRQGVHLVVIEYFEQTGNAIAQVSFQNSLPATLPPAIASFTATPAVITQGQPATLSWNVSGATTISLNNAPVSGGGTSSESVSPTQTTTYTLTASNGAGTSMATTTVTVTPEAPAQPPTAPTLLSARAASSGEVDMSWTASTDSQGVAGYRISRNGVNVASVPGATLSWSDTSVSAQTTYTYMVQAYDAASLYSQASNSIQVTTPAAASPVACPAPATGSFTGCYFDNTTLSGYPVFVRNDPQIDFYWQNSSPSPSLVPMNFSVRWRGNFAFTAGNYTFTGISSDGVRLYMDGTPLINEWEDEAPTTWTATRAVSPGTHLIEVDYYEHTGQSLAIAFWRSTTAAPSLPVISSFTATPSSTAAGQAVQLAWAVANTTTVSIAGLGTVSGSSLAVSPTQTTTYTLTASGPGGNSTANATVTIKGTTPDTQPPSAPKLVSAIAAGPNTVNLVWTAGSDNVGVAGYQILRNGSAVASLSASTLAWSDTQVTPGSVYTYGVRAFDAAGNYSVGSNTVQVTVPQATSAPVIVSFTVTPTSTSLGKAVTLAWVVTGATNTSITPSVGSVTNSSSAAVLPGATTTYTLLASNASGSNSASVTVTIQQSPDTQAPSVPTLVSATAAAPTQVNLVWNASTDNIGVAGYQVIRNGAVVATTPGTTTTYADSTVTASSTYSYSIKAFDGAGNYSAASSAIQVSTPAASDISVTWYGACWEPTTLDGITGNFQSISFALTTSSPVPMQGTLFFAPNCSPAAGTDNMNDTGWTLTSTHMIIGFTHHPNVIPSSAMYWFGNLTANGMCPAGAPCSGCVNYTSTTLSCNLVP